jgi:sialic acid synthase SpsE
LSNKIFRNISRPYFIGEISANHNGNFSTAKNIILTAKKFGVDAVKLQTYTPDTMTIPSDNREFKIISKEEAKKMIDENPETKLNK